MISSVIRVTDKYVNSPSVSIQQEHLELFLKDQLYSIVLQDSHNNVLHEYKDHELAKLLGSAIANGRRRGRSETDFYYLGTR